MATRQKGLIVCDPKILNGKPVDDEVLFVSKICMILNEQECEYLSYPK